MERDQLWLMPPSLADWLPSDHQAWFVLDVIAELDLSSFYRSLRADGRGGASYHTELILGVLLYAYMCRGAVESLCLELTDTPFTTQAKTRLTLLSGQSVGAQRRLERRNATSIRLGDSQAARNDVGVFWKEGDGALHPETEVPEFQTGCGWCGVRLSVSGSDLDVIGIDGPLHILGHGRSAIVLESPILGSDYVARLVPAVSNRSEHRRRGPRLRTPCESVVGCSGLLFCSRLADVFVCALTVKSRITLATTLIMEWIDGKASSN